MPHRFKHVVLVRAKHPNAAEARLGTGVILNDRAVMTARHVARLPDAVLGETLDVRLAGAYAARPSASITHGSVAVQHQQESLPANEQHWVEARWERACPLECCDVCSTTTSSNVPNGRPVPTIRVDKVLVDRVDVIGFPQNAERLEPADTPHRSATILSCRVIVLSETMHTMKLTIVDDDLWKRSPGFRRRMQHQMCSAASRVRRSSTEMSLWES